MVEHQRHIGRSRRLRFRWLGMSFQIQQISDNAGPFDALGQKRVADAVAQAEEDVSTTGPARASPMAAANSPPKFADSRIAGRTPP